LASFAHGLDLVGDFVHRDDRRLVDDDAFSMREDECIRCAQVDGQVAGEEAEEGPHVVNAGVTHLKIV
jgi:hypothetical protein